MDKGPLEKHYDNLYSDPKPTFGGENGEPVDFVKNIILYIKEGKVLELGAGQGRNSIWLARNGFKVEARDISSVGIESIKKVAIEEKLSVIAIKKTAQEKLTEEYNIIVSTFMFHHISRANSLEIIKDIKNHTISGGLNVITTFTKDGDFFRGKPNTDNFYPDLGEMKELYEEWNILQYEEVNSKARATNEDGSPMFNISAKIIAQKP